MACSANQLLVSGVTSYPNANGVYTALDPVTFATVISNYGAIKIWQRISGTEGFIIYQAANLSSWDSEVFSDLPEGTTNIYNPDESFTDPGIQYIANFGYVLNTGGQDLCPEFFTWSNGVTVTSYSGAPSAEPTFGLPADVVALITSRFGSVARFLRLRNQGQV